MVKPPSFDSNGMKKGAWSKEEDDRLRAFVHEFGHSNWRLLPLQAGLARCGKSCRLRWVNYLKPGLKRGKFTKHEEELIIKLHDQLGNRWSAIAVKMPGRTDNEIKNYWHAHIKKRGRRPPLMPQEQVSSSSSSSQINSCVTTDNQEESADKTPHDQNSTNDLDPIADLFLFAQAQDHIFTADLSPQGCISHINVDLPAIPVEEFHDFALLQEMQNDPLNSSDGGSSNLCSSSSGEFRTNFWSDSFEEDIFDLLELW